MTGGLQLGNNPETDQQRTILRIVLDTIKVHVTN